MFMDFVDVAKIVNHYGVPNNFYVNIIHTHLISYNHFGTETSRV